MANSAPKSLAKAAFSAFQTRLRAPNDEPTARFILATGAAALPLTILGFGFSNMFLAGASGLVLCGAAGLGLAQRFANKGDQDQHNGADAAAVHTIMDNLKDGIIQFDCAGQITLRSKAVSALLGDDGLALATEELIERIHVLDRPLFMTSFAAAHKDGEAKTIQLRLRRDEAGTQVAPNFVWTEIFLSPNQSVTRDAQAFAVTATLTDISQAKTDAQLLSEVQAAAQEASDAKNQFLAVIGHELRTPLNAIVGFSDLMANGIGGDLGPTHLEYVGLISQSGHHLLEMVNMLLDKSKIDAGRFELQAERFEPEKLVAPCVQLVSKVAREKNIELDVQMGKGLPEVLADERACRQILINLLSNAVKFTENGGRVTWSMKRSGAHLAITVSDTGIGMSPEVVARLGETFFQAQTSADRNFEGTGLGISIVKGLVDLHDGTMNVQSKKGEGTSVHVMLPINGPEAKPHNVSTLNPVPEEAPASHDTAPHVAQKRLA